MYVCEDGYALHGHGHHNCTIDGVWTGELTEKPVCEGGAEYTLANSANTIRILSLDVF